MDLKQIRYYCAVCANGSFSRAATVLNVSQSALSKQVRALEDDLGVLLLIRDGRGVHLTPQGADLYERLLGIEAQLAEAQAAIATTAGSHKTIAIGATPLIGTGFLATLIDRIKTETPFTSIRLVEGYSQQVNAMLRSGTLDIAIGYGLSDGPHAEMLGELQQGMRLVAGEDRDLPDGPVPFKALAKLPIVTFDPPSRVKSLLTRHAADLGLTLAFRHSIDSLPLILELVRKGDGVTVLPASALCGPHVHGLTQRQIGPEPLSMTMQVAASLRAGVSSEVYLAGVCISDMLRQHCAEGPESWADSTWSEFR
jgi:LysR family nitrogen assimilation transcriptional regulator